jgi:2-dehydro-3-deoxyglucarate aldolase
MSDSLKAKIRAGQPTVGSWITIGHPAVAEILARAGFDWLVVDMEHSSLSLGQAGELIRTIDLCGVAALVRLTSNDADQIKRIMDAGACGVVVPMVNTAEAAARAVASVHYPPRGFRGVGLGRAQRYGAGFRDYVSWLETDAVVVVQIEHYTAVANIDAILGVDGVDAFIIGPYDLSCSLGVSGQLEHPRVLEAIAAVRAAGVKAMKPGGTHLVEPEPDRLGRALAEGHKFIPYGVDFRFLDCGARAGIRIRS